MNCFARIPARIFLHNKGLFSFLAILPFKSFNYEINYFQLEVECTALEMANEQLKTAGAETTAELFFLITFFILQFLTLLHFLSLNLLLH